MAVYAVGDVQGCADALDRLLDRLRFDPAHDRLWLVGDLVNRGPDSLGVLRRIHALGEAAVCVLGNHDLHLLAVAAGVRKPRAGDTFDAILDAPERDVLIEWLATRPLLHHDPALGWAMVHAGIPPEWDWATATAAARSVEALLRDPTARRTFLEWMYGNEPRRWRDADTAIARQRFAINALTRMRAVEPDGALDLAFDGEPRDLPAGRVPWTDALAPGLPRLVCGHWSAAGLRRTANTLQLDTGCVWGRTLTAATLTVDGSPLDCPVTAVPCPTDARQRG